MLVALVSLAGCGGSDSDSSSATSALSSQVTTPLQPSLIKTEVNLDITAATVAGDVVTINFQLVDKDGVGINHLTSDDFSVTLAKLNPSSFGNYTGNWQSYINKIEIPTVGEGIFPKMQAILESAASGQFVNNNDGTYQYSYAQSVNISDSAILEQAETESLDISFNAKVVHRAGMQLSIDDFKRNATFDWIPETGETELDGIFDHAIASTENCNSCHGELAMHGGSRFEVKYCVTCHNPGSTDANSGNTVNFKNMIHKIHRGKNLPSVQAGEEYKIYGFRDSIHDYSNLVYPNDILSCQNCHAGNATAMPEQLPTVSGDNWREVATQAACGSCHDDVDFTQHYGGQLDDTNCRSCHQNSAIAGSIENRHRNLKTEASKRFLAEILNVTNTSAGQFPVVQFKITNPETNEAYDILSDAEWTQGDGKSTLSVDFAWSTTDYTNTGNQGDNASSVSQDALSTAIDNGDGSFTFISDFAIPDGSLVPNQMATGSGNLFISGHPAVASEPEKPDQITRVPLANTASYFSIDETANQAVARRTVVSTEQCLICHGDLIKHGSSKSNNVEVCVACHNPRNTDKRTRLVAQTPPTDGKQEESLDFKTMIHAIHASSKRENSLQLVGFQGFNTYVYDKDRIRYPNQLNNCTVCHVNSSYQLPLVDSVLGTTIDTGADIQNHMDDSVISPTVSVCSSCHDNAEAKAHMQANGGSFNTTQQQIDSGAVVEQCSVCHGVDRVYAVDTVHEIE